MTNRTGPISASRWSTPRTASSSRAWSDLGLAAASVATAGPSAGRAGPDRSAAADHRLELVGFSVPDEPPKGLDDRAVRHAAVADVRAATEEHAHPPRRRHRRASATRRDLPTPASPATSWWTGAPAMALSRAGAIAASSVARPTSVGLTRRRGIDR